MARVLAVEDEPSIQTTLCGTLRLIGFKTYHAGDVEEALKILGVEHIDAITLDVRLPDSRGLQRSGVSLLAFLRATGKYANVLVLIFTVIALRKILAPEARAHVVDFRLQRLHTPFHLG